MPRGSIIAAAAVAAMLVIVAYAQGSSGAYAGGGCHAGATKFESTATTVRMKANCFITTVARVDEGATVTWTNDDEVAHNINGAAFGWGAFDDLLGGEEVSYAFPQTGVYVYECTIHPGMTGAIVVGDGTGTDPASVQPAAAAAATIGDPPGGTGSASSEDEATSSADGVGRTLLAAAGAAAAALVVCAAAFVLLRARREQATA